MESHSAEAPDADQENQATVTTPIVPRVQEGAGPGTGAGEQHRRGLKRSRRDRGSTAKERISKMPPCAAGKRSSIYRGVTRHRWTGRYEAHLWDKSTWNQSQNKKGKQVYLGAYDEEEAAARAYDLAALKYWGPGTLINFPLSDYTRDVDEMQNVTREEYLASLRRKSSGFSRGVSKYRGVARQHFNGRWEARVGRVFGNKYLYLGTYGSQEEAAAAYDMATMEYRGVNTVTNFDLSRYIRWLRPGHNSTALHESNAALSPNTPLTGLTDEQHGGQDDHSQSTEPSYQLPSLGLGPPCTQKRSPSSPAALTLLLQSPMFKQMLERASAAVSAAAECDSLSTDPSEVSHRMDLDHQSFNQQQQQVDQSDHYSPCQWGQQEQQMPSPVEDDVDGAVYHSQDESTSYHPSVTSNFHHQNIVGHQQHLDNYRAELEGSVVYHSQDLDLHEPTSYHLHQSVTSDYQQDAVGHYVELGDHKQHREHLQQQQYPELHGSHQHALQRDHHLDEAFDHHGGLVPWLGGVGAIQ